MSIRSSSLRLPLLRGAHTRTLRTTAVRLEDREGGEKSPAAASDDVEAGPSTATSASELFPSYSESNEEHSLPRSLLDPPEPSAFDEAFSGPGAKAQSDSSSARRNGATVPSYVLGGSRASSLTRTPRPQTRRSALTPEESKVFERVLDHYEWGMQSRSPAPSANAFGSSVGQRGAQGLRGWRDLNLLTPNTRELFKKARGDTPRMRAKALGALREGQHVESVSAEEMQHGISKAREELSECQTIGQVWQWAEEEVFGAPVEEAQMQPPPPQPSAPAGQEAADASTAAAEDEQEAAASETANEAETSAAESQAEPDAASVAAEMLAEASQEGTDAAQAPFDEEANAEDAHLTTPEPPRYGLTTPYYAPVINLLVKELRERFKSPLSALAVVTLTKSRGADSLVLGCTPALYTEAVKTRWNVLGDLVGARNAIREARATGVLGPPPKGGSQRVTATFEEEDPLRVVVEGVNADAQRASTALRPRTGVRDGGTHEVETRGAAGAQSLRIAGQMSALTGRPIRLNMLKVDEPDMKGRARSRQSWDDGFQSSRRPAPSSGRGGGGYRGSPQSGYKGHSQSSQYQGARWYSS